jgi:cellulose synthase/poly-beta-1,6-N-acetylglucosamine synthase-like glycosyltransferase
LILSLTKETSQKNINNKDDLVMNNKPLVSIIVPVRNAERTLEQTFEYLFKVQYPHDKLEIIIADGGSSDSTVQVIKSWQVKYPFITLVEVPNCPSPGFARNKAIVKAKGDYLLFTDGDCAPEPDWIEQLLLPFSKDESIGGVGGEIHTLRTDKENITESYCEQVGFLSVRGRFSIKEEGLMPKLTDFSPSQVSAHRAPFFATANVIFSKKAIEKAGAFFWDHPTGEDVDFSIQIQKAGFKLYYAPKAIVNHMHRVDMKSFNKQWFGYGKGHSYLVEKHATSTFEIVFQCIPGNPLLKIPSPLKGLVYLGNFHMIALTFVMALISLIGSLVLPGLLTLGLIFFVLWLFFMYRYFNGCINLVPKKNFFTWCYIKWITNYWFIKGGLEGTKKTGILYIEPSW